MAGCEMCGRKAELVSAEVEGVTLTVCSSCAGYGTVQKKNSSVRSFTRVIQKEDPPFHLLPEYASLLRSVREKKEMTQEEFATFIQEKVSIVAKWETGDFRPRLDIARKLERMLGIRLVEEEEAPAAAAHKKNKDDVLTLGDFVKIRKRN